MKQAFSQDRLWWPGVLRVAAKKKLWPLAYHQHAFRTAEGYGSVTWDPVYRVYDAQVTAKNAVLRTQEKNLLNLVAAVESFFKQTSEDGQTEHSAQRR